VEIGVHLPSRLTAKKFLTFSQLSVSITVSYPLKDGDELWFGTFDAGLIK
jgi:hypothetical protein